MVLIISEHVRPTGALLACCRSINTCPRKSLLCTVEVELQVQYWHIPSFVSAPWTISNNCHDGGIGSIKGILWSFYYPTRPSLILHYKNQETRLCIIARLIALHASISPTSTTPQVYVWYPLFDLTEQMGPGDVSGEATVTSDGTARYPHSLKWTRRAACGPNTYHDYTWA